MVCAVRCQTLFAQRASNWAPCGDKVSCLVHACGLQWRAAIPPLLSAKIESCMLRSSPCDRISSFFSNNDLLVVINGQIACEFDIRTLTSIRFLAGCSTMFSTRYVHGCLAWSVYSKATLQGFYQEPALIDLRIARSRQEKPTGKIPLIRWTS